MTGDPTCILDPNPNPDWDIFTCESIAVIGEGPGSHAWIVNFDPPCTERPVAISSFIVMLDGIEARDFAFREVKFVKSSVVGAKWSYGIIVDDRAGLVRLKGPTVRCQFIYKKAKDT